MRLFAENWRESLPLGADSVVGDYVSFCGLCLNWFNQIALSIYTAV